MLILKHGGLNTVNAQCSFIMQLKHIHGVHIMPCITSVSNICLAYYTRLTIIKLMPLHENTYRFPVYFPHVSFVVLHGSLEIV